MGNKVRIDMGYSFGFVFRVFRGHVRKNDRMYSRRLQFVKLALKAQTNMAGLCRLFRFSRKTGYKWKARFERDGIRGLQDQSRRPMHSPRQISCKWLTRLRVLRR